MLLFCDESGDPGMPGQSGVSSYFAVGIICCRDGEMEKSHACPQLQMADMLVGFHACACRKGWRKIPKGLHHLEANLRWCS